MRHFSHLSNIAPKKEIGQAVPPAEEPNPVYRFRLASLAHQLGIRTDKVAKSVQKDPKVEAARRFLEQAWPAPFFQYGPADIESSIEQILTVLPDRHGMNLRSIDKPRFSSEAGETLDRRTGRPFQNSYTVDRHFLFLPNMVHGQQSQGEEVTSFFVRKDIFCSFFGEPTDELLGIQVRLVPFRPDFSPRHQGLSCTANRCTDG